MRLLKYEKIVSKSGIPVCFDSAKVRQSACPHAANHILRRIKLYFEPQKGKKSGFQVKKDGFI